MGTYKIEISEILSTVIEIEAENLEQAIEIAHKKYDNEEITLDYVNFVGHTIKPY